MQPFKVGNHPLDMNQQSANPRMKERLRWIGAFGLAYLVIYFSAYWKKGLFWNLISQISDAIGVFLG